MNILNTFGLSLATLDFQIGCPIILLRNLTLKHGLYNNSSWFKQDLPTKCWRPTCFRVYMSKNTCSFLAFHYPLCHPIAILIHAILNCNVISICYDCEHITEVVPTMSSFWVHWCLFSIMVNHTFQFSTPWLQMNCGSSSQWYYGFQYKQHCKSKGFIGIKLVGVSTNQTTSLYLTPQMSMWHIYPIFIYLFIYSSCIGRHKSN